MLVSRRVLLVASIAAFAIGATLVWRAYLPATWPLDVVNHTVGRDFVNIWGAGRLLLEGHGAALLYSGGYEDALRRLVHPALTPHYWSYPPTSLLLAVPFGVLPYGWALALWTLVGLALFLAVGRIGLTGEPARAAMILLAIAPATANNILCGQNGFLTAALLAGGLLQLDRKPLLAGVLLGLLSYKPHFGIVVVPALIALGAWRTIAVAAATAAALVAASIVAFGIEPWQLYLGDTVPKHAILLANFEGFFTKMLVSPYAGLRHLGWSHGAAMLAQVILALATIAAVVIPLRQIRDREMILLLVSAGTFVASPYALTYDLPVLALAIARLAVRQPLWTRRDGYLLGAAWAVPLLGVPLVLLGLPLQALVLMLTFTMFCGQAWPALGHGWRPAGATWRHRS